MLKIEHLKKNYDTFSLVVLWNSGRVCDWFDWAERAGKSTTFKAVLGLIAIDGGTITILGKDIREFTAKDREKLGVVLSDSGFSGYLRIKDLIPILENLYEKFDKTFFVEQAERFRLPPDKQIKDFSTGMKAKLKLLAAISHDGKIIDFG